jgi:hypothetical protein
MNDADDILADECASELMEGIEKKDKKMVREALRALVLHICDQDESYEEGEK